TGLWKSENIFVMSAVTNGPRPPDNRWPTLLVGASSPVSDTYFVRIPSRTLREDAAYYLERQRRSARADEAIRLAGADADVETNLRTWTTVSQTNPYAPRSLQTNQAVLLNAVERWVSAAETLPAPQKAAALLAADHLLSETPGAYQ